MKLIYPRSNLIVCLVLLNLFSCSEPINEQVELNNSPKDSLSTYWFNANYSQCITAGNPPCDCLSKNEIAMFYIDRENKKITIQSSVFHFGMETMQEFDFEYRKREYPSELFISKTPPLKDSITFRYGSIIWIKYNGIDIRFDKRLG